MKRTEITMWTFGGYTMTPQVFESKKKAVEHGKWMKNNGYIHGFKTRTI